MSWWDVIRRRPALLPKQPVASQEVTANSAPSDPVRALIDTALTHGDASSRRSALSALLKMSPAILTEAAISLVPKLVEELEKERAWEAMILLRHVDDPSAHDAVRGIQKESSRISAVTSHTAGEAIEAATKIAPAWLRRQGFDAIVPMLILAMQWQSRDYRIAVANAFQRIATTFDLDPIVKALRDSDRAPFRVPATQQAGRVLGEVGGDFIAPPLLTALKNHTTGRGVLLFVAAAFSVVRTDAAVEPLLASIASFEGDGTRCVESSARARLTAARAVSIADAARAIAPLIKLTRVDEVAEEAVLLLTALLESSATQLRTDDLQAAANLDDVTQFLGYEEDWRGGNPVMDNVDCATARKLARAELARRDSSRS